MEPRMPNPGKVIQEATKPIQDMWAAAHHGGVAPKTLHLVHLRASQINGCSFCVSSAPSRGRGRARRMSAAAWRDAPYFTEAERAALA